jgi:hypothetical protein
VHACERGAMQVLLLGVAAQVWQTTSTATPKRYNSMVPLSQPYVLPGGGHHQHSRCWDP